MNIKKEDQINLLTSQQSILNVLHRSAYFYKNMAINNLQIIKAIFLTYIFQANKACATTRVQPTRALEISCEHFLPWSSVDWQDHHQEAGEICQFNVESISPQELWIMSNFSCGSNSRRIVMCEKAFDLFVKVCNLNFIFCLCFWI